MEIVNLLGFSLVVYASYLLLTKFIHNKLRQLSTAVDDLQFLGQSRQEGNRIPGTAVVCGGSIAGLLSARVCSDHFERVLIVDPEEWLSTADGMVDRHRELVDGQAIVTSLSPPQKRSRVFQYTFMHGYQMFLPNALQRMFKNFESEVKSSGGRLVPLDFQIYWSGIPFPLKASWRGSTPPNVLGMSRPGLETMLRRLIMMSCANVSCMAGTVTSLVQKPGTTTTQGVKVRTAWGDREQIISAVFVADCTGPARAGLKWLKELKSYSDLSQLPLENLKESYSHKLTTSSWEIAIPPNLIPRIHALGFPGDFESAWAVLNCAPDPREDKRAIAVVCQENNMINLACGGWGIDDAPHTLSEAKAYANQIRLARPLPHWVIPFIELLEKEKLPAVHLQVRVPPAVYVHYEKAEGLPSNFVVMGDAAMHMNPLQGYGVTKACVDAVTLNGILAKLPGNALPDTLGRKFFKAQANRTSSKWDQTKVEDYAFDTTTAVQGENRDTYQTWVRWYNIQIVKLMLKDPVVTGIWLQTQAWLAPATDLLSPMVLGKVAWILLQEKVSQVFKRPAGDSKVFS